jgi:hypothetical protein
MTVVFLSDKHSKMRQLAWNPELRIKGTLFSFVAITDSNFAKSVCDRKIIAITDSLHRMPWLHSSLLG